MRRLVLAVLLGGLIAQPCWAAGEAGLAKAQEAAVALTKGDTTAALALYTDALADQELTNDRRSSILSDRAVVYARLNMPKLSIDDYNRAIQLYPENAATYNNRGNTLLALGLTKEAQRDFDRAIVLAPGYAAAYNNRAGALMRLGQINEAIQDYTKAIELMPASAAPLGGRGRAHLADQRPHAALRDFNRAVNADDRFATGYRARAEAKMAIDRYEEATEDLSRAIAFDAGNAELVLLRGRAYMLAGNLVAAIKDQTRAIELDPGRAAAYEARGLAHVKIDAIEAAEADLAKALELNPRSALAFAYRAYLYRRTGRNEVAQREIEKAVRLDATRADVLWVRGEIAEALGRSQEAIGHYSKVIAAEPTHKESIGALERLGALVAQQDDVEVDGGLDPWRVVRRAGQRYFAISPTYPRLRIPLEMMGGGQPKLLEWELRPAPFTGIALLRFSSGRNTAGDEIEQVAILDLAANAIVGIEPHRQGSKTSEWTWNDGRVTVASVDGVSDEFILRQAPRPVAADRRVTVGAQPKWGVPDWAPWASSGFDSGPRGSSKQGPPPGKKPKTLFDLLLGN